MAASAKLVAAARRNGKANKGGRPRIDVMALLPEFERLGGIGLNEWQACAVVGISPDTLSRRKKERDEVLRALKTGLANAGSRVGQTLFQKALDGDLGAIVWWEKTRLGYREGHSVEMTGAGGGPLEIAVTRRVVGV